MVLCVFCCKLIQGFFFRFPSPSANPGRLDFFTWRSCICIHFFAFGSVRCVFFAAAQCALEIQAVQLAEGFSPARSASLLGSETSPCLLPQVPGFCTDLVQKRFTNSTDSIFLQWRPLRGASSHFTPYANSVERSRGRN